LMFASLPLSLVFVQPLARVIGHPDGTNNALAEIRVSAYFFVLIPILRCHCVTSSLGCGNLAIH
jgi:hypothetical protein